MNPPDLSKGDGDAVAEAREMAVLEFEPLDNTGMIVDFSQPTWGEMIADLGIDLRLAALTIDKTKPELIAMARDMLGADDDGEGFFKLMERLGDTGKRLKSFVEIVNSAFSRLNVAASVVAIEEKPAKGGAA